MNSFLEMVMGQHPPLYQSWEKPANLEGLRQVMWHSQLSPCCTPQHLTLDANISLCLMGGLAWPITLYYLKGHEKDILSILSNLGLLYLSNNQYNCNSYWSLLRKTLKLILGKAYFWEGSLRRKDHLLQQLEVRGENVSPASFHTQQLTAPVFQASEKRCFYHYLPKYIIT